MSIKVNNQYGKLYLYNLNNQLYLFAYDYLGYPKAFDCIVYNDAADTINQWQSVGLMMNTEDRTSFLIDYFNDAGECTSTDVYAAQEGYLILTGY